MTRVLNVGCGPDRYGTDFVDLYPARPEVVRCDVSRERLPYPDEAFDEVYSKNLFEHVSNPEHCLNEMQRVTRRGGTVRIITDNAGWVPFHLPLRANNYLEHYSNAPREGDDDRHYYLFTPLHLENLFRRVGLDVAGVGYEYHSKRRAARALRPLLRFLGRTPLRHVVYPHIEIVGRRPG